VSADHEVIKRIIDAFERSDWAEIDVRAGSVRVHLSADATTARPVAARPSARAESPPAAPEPAAAPPATFPAGAHAVVSPSPGIFWRAPQPGAPPFADVGDRVAPTTTMCIVEVMKLMTHVKSAVAGTVLAVLVDDGARVDQGDALFAVAPEP
jgi:acetyl-CoA carboxylase biotin carboxyl carrier protein